MKILEMEMKRRPSTKAQKREFSHRKFVELVLRSLSEAIAAVKGEEISEVAKTSEAIRQLTEKELDRPSTIHIL